MWALVWLPIGLAVALYAASSPPQPSDVISRPVSVALFLTAWTAWGGISGAGFALILGFTERRRSLGELSLARTTVWGALGAMTVPTVLTLIDLLRMPVSLPLYDWRFPLVALAASASLGAVCGAVTLTLARRPTG
jgi:hypothetical protein